MRQRLTNRRALALLAGMAATGLFAQDGHRFTVVFRASTVPANAESIVQGAGGTISNSVPEVGMVEVNGPISVMDLLKAHPDVLAATPGIELNVAPMKLVEASFDGSQTEAVNLPGAFYYNLYQWDIKQVTNQGASFALSSGSHQTVVGIIDTGINTGHRDLAANLLGGRNFVNDGPGGTILPNDIEDRVGHGSHVAGNIAGNGLILGVGPDLGIRSYRVFGATGGTPTARVINAILTATHDHVDVISMSLGGFNSISGGYWTDPSGVRHRFDSDVADMLAYKRAVAYAIQHGVTVVASAGNDALNISNPANITTFLNQTYGPDGYTFLGASRKAPGGLPGVITVSATGPDDSLASYSNWGPSAIDVSAPGGDFLRYPAPDYYTDMNLSSYRASSATPHRYAWMAGTSMAAPKASAIAALIIDNAKRQGTSLSPAQVAAALQKSAVDLGKVGHDPFFGDGGVSAYRALGGQ